MAAAGDEKERDDKDPDPVIVEKTAKTVVIHKISSLGDMCFELRTRFSLSYYAERAFM